MNRQSISINIPRRNQGYNKKEEEQKGTPKRREKTSSCLRVVKRLSRSVKDDDAEDDARTQRTTGARACDARDG